MVSPIDPPPAPVGLAITRRHTTAAGSARGLLFTMLGEFALPVTGPVWTNVFLDLFLRLGIEEKAARQAINRTATDGWLRAERVGRRTRWHLTPAAVTLLREGTERIFDFTAVQEDWDEQWLFVHARVPEVDRSDRHLIRSRLSWAGFGALAPGLWITTHLDRRPEAERILAEAKATEDSLIIQGEVLAGQPASAMAGQAWDLAALEAEYDEFVAAFEGRPNGDPLLRLTNLVHAWRRFPWADPALPVSLLPTPWRGLHAVELFHRRHDNWVDSARAEWARMND